jgi:hypothetical protein
LPRVDVFKELFSTENSDRCFHIFHLSEDSKETIPSETCGDVTFITYIQHRAAVRIVAMKPKSGKD